MNQHWRFFITGKFLQSFRVKSIRLTSDHTWNPSCHSPVPNPTHTILIEFRSLCLLSYYPKTQSSSGPSQPAAHTDTDAHRTPLTIRLPPLPGCPSPQSFPVKFVSLLPLGMQFVSFLGGGVFLLVLLSDGTLRVGPSLTKVRQSSISLLGTKLPLASSP
ncbi:hypothetical protein LIA77_01702 [Sarocladium implicatum]|nr:hypothetical protein LIA77_01702 [Sarocladium implicatum]